MMTTQQPTMTTTRQLYEQALQAMKQARETVQNLQQSYQKELQRDYPLSQMLGKSVYYSRCKWGAFEDSYKHFTLDEQTIDNYSYLKTHLIVMGEEANRMFDTFRFNDKQEYLLYVIYDEDWYESDNSIPLIEWPLYEFMIVPI